MPRRALAFQDFDAVAADVDQLHRGGYSKVGKWDLTQACQHLTATMNLLLDGTSLKAPWLVRKLVAPLVLRKIMKTGKMGEGVHTPAILVPRGGEEEETAIRTMRVALERMQKKDVVYQPHPFFESADQQTLRRLQLIHAAHHLSFLIPANPSAASSASATPHSGASR